MVTSGGLPSQDAVACWGRIAYRDGGRRRMPGTAPASSDLAMRLSDGAEARDTDTPFRS